MLLVNLLYYFLLYAVKFLQDKAWLQYISGMYMHTYQVLCCI